MQGNREAKWRSTKLWQELDRRSDEPANSLKALVDRTLPKVEEVLAGGTAPTDFTLHDAEHSHRVAERMAEIAGDELLGELPPHDLAMLLLSAYLHDIGMTPPLAKVEGHLALLLSGDGSALGDGEREALQAWLDDERDGLTPPLVSGAPSVEELRLARQIIAGYVRHSHNRWSETWIRENLRGLDAPYPGWLDDLVRLCKSHHYNIDQLKSEAFAPRLVGSPATVLHPRYCACLLRVADVLDFDPERTPEILFTHRDVAESSAIFWHKDHNLAFALKDNHLVLHAQPPDAVTHRAILLTIRGVDEELLLSRRLADETHFQRMANDDEDLPHRWTLDTNVRSVVTPRNGDYEYVDGTFRPDPARLLELVGGVQLYGSRLAAIRELLQNAFDAVREQIARERLLQEDPADDRVRERIALTHRVSLTLERTDSGLRLVCRDTGTGMSRDTITSRFLVGGTTSGHDIRQLERTCAEHGFTVGRTARFGIGVLSYFLLARHLEVRTRRSIEAGDPDGSGWTFTSFGLADFGELRPSPDRPTGTTVVLEILSDAFTDSEDKFAEEVEDYVSRTVRRTPCPFSFEAIDFKRSGFSSGLGWPSRAEEVAEEMLPMITPGRPDATRLELLARSLREAHLHDEERLQARHNHAKQALTLRVEEGELPNQLGAFRIFFGYFELAPGKSLVHLDLEAHDDGAYSIALAGRATGRLLSTGLEHSWNGMNVYAESVSDPQGVDPKNHMLSAASQPLNTYIEIDWTSAAAGRLAVDRHSFRPSEAALEALLDVKRRALAMLTELGGESGPALALLNSQAIGELVGDLGEPAWPQRYSDEETVLLTQIKLPALRSHGVLVEHENLSWRGKPVAPIIELEIQRGDGGGEYKWAGALLDPQTIGVYKRGSGLRPVAVWEEFKRRQVSGVRLGEQVAPFPPGWEKLAGFKLHYFRAGLDSLWNPEHPLLRAIDGASAEWAMEAFRDSIDPVPLLSTVLSSRGRAAAWIMACIEEGAGDIWGGLADRAPGFLAEAFDLIDGLGREGEILYYNERAFSGRALVVLTTSTWKAHSGASGERLLGAKFKTPGDDWLLQPSGDNAAA